MAVYVYSDRQIEAMVAKALRWRTIFMALSIVIFGISVLLLIYFPDVPLFRRPASDWALMAITFLFFPLIKTLRGSRTWAGRLREKVRKTSVEISSSAVAVDGPLGHTQFWPSEILRAEEPRLGAGLYLRTASRYRWVLIRRTLDGYAQIKRELQGLGIPLESTFMAPNWEEYLAVLLVVSISICTLVTSNVRVLTVNFLLSVPLAFAMLYVINSNPHSSPQMRWAKFGAFLPMIFAGVALWSALHR